MKRLHLDLAPFSLRRQLYRLHPAARLLALTGLVLCAMAGFRAQKLLTHLDALDSQAARFAARAEQSVRASMKVTGEPIEAKQAAAVNAAVARLNLPWDGILNALEAATPDTVAVLSITPEPGRALLRIEAQCSGSRDMIDYLKGLGSSRCSHGSTWCGTSLSATAPRV